MIKEQLTMRLPTLSQFGACPVCHEARLFMNVHKSNYCLCEDHKVAWLFGWNLLSHWRHETQEEWDSNLKRLEAEFQRVEPALWEWESVPLFSKRLYSWGREWFNFAMYRFLPTSLQRWLAERWLADDVPF